MSANSVALKVNDKAKSLSFAEMLTSGSNYSVSIEGSTVGSGSLAIMSVCHGENKLVAYAEITNSTGALSTNTEELGKIFQKTPIGAVIQFFAILHRNEVDAGENMAVGMVSIVSAGGAWTDDTTGAMTLFRGHDGHTATIHLKNFNGSDKRGSDPANAGWLCASSVIDRSAFEADPDTYFAFLNPANLNNAVYMSMLVDAPDSHWVFGASGLVIATHPNYKQIVDEESPSGYTIARDEERHWIFRAVEYYGTRAELPTPEENQILVQASGDSLVEGYILVTAEIAPNGPRGFGITDVQIAEVINGDTTTTTKVAFYTDEPDAQGQAPRVLRTLPVVARNGHTATIHMQKFAGRDNKITDPTNPNLALAFLCMSAHVHAKQTYPTTNFAFVTDAEYNNAIYQSKLVDIPTDQHWVFGATGLVIATHPNYKDVETSAGVFETILDENHYWEFRALEYYKEGDALPTPSDDQILVKAETGSATGGYLLVGAGLVDTPRGPQGRSLIDVDVSCVEEMPCSTITHVDVFVDKPECGDGKRCKLTSFCVYARNGTNGTDGAPGLPGEKGEPGEKGCKGCKGCAGEGEGWRIHSDCSCVTTGSSGVKIYYGNSADGGVGIRAERGGIGIYGNGGVTICSPGMVVINGSSNGFEIKGQGSKIKASSAQINFCNQNCKFLFNGKNLTCFVGNGASICGCNGFVDTDHNCGVVIYAGCYGEDSPRDVRIYAAKNVRITADRNLSFCSHGSCSGKIYFNGREFQPGKILGQNGEVSVDVGSSGVMIFAKCAGWVDIGNTCKDTNVHGRGVIVEGGIYGITLCAGVHGIGLGSSGVFIDGGCYIPAHKPLADDFKSGCNYPKGSFVYYGRDYYQAMVDIRAGSAWPSLSSDWSKRNLSSLFSNENGSLISTIETKVNAMFDNGETEEF